MRALVVFSMVALATGQYNYEPGAGVNEGNSNDGSQNQGDLLVNNEFHKEFYSYSAPEQEFMDPSANDQILNSLKRNLKVLFIRGPENTALENAALQLAKTASDDRTAIYVLNKQTDIGDLANKLNSLRSGVNHKPDVHFIKYRTPADAENAQRTIQSQYDTLPGSTSNHNGGSAPVLDFTSKTSGSSLNNGANNPSRGFVSPPSGAYLPPSKR